MNCGREDSRILKKTHVVNDTFLPFFENNVIPTTNRRPKSKFVMKKGDETRGILVDDDLNLNSFYLYSYSTLSRTIEDSQ